MPALRTYSVFICHDWEYSDDYGGVSRLLNAAPNFDWLDLSVPEHDPLDANDRLEYHLRNQIRPADVVLVLAGMYTARSDWIDWEMRFARRIGTPIVGVVPWGNRIVARAAQDAAVELVGWSGKSIVSAIRRHGRR